MNKHVRNEVYSNLYSEAESTQSGESGNYYTRPETDELVRKAVAPKVDKAYVTDAIKDLPTKTFVEHELGKKADKTYVDETFATKKELYDWGHPEVPQGESSEANVNTLDTIKNVGRYSLAFDYKGNPLPSDDYAFLLVTRKVDNGDIRQEYSHINVNFEADTSTVMFAYRMYDTTKQEWSGWAVIDSVSGGDITETLKNYYTKKQADETFSTVLAHDALATAITDIYNQKVGYEEIYTREESDARFALKGEIVEPVPAKRLQLNIGDRFNNAYGTSNSYATHENNEVSIHVDVANEIAGSVLDAQGEHIETILQSILLCSLEKTFMDELTSKGKTLQVKKVYIPHMLEYPQGDNAGYAFMGITTVEVDQNGQISTKSPLDINKVLYFRFDIVAEIIDK